MKGKKMASLQEEENNTKYEKVYQEQETFWVLLHNDVI